MSERELLSRAQHGDKIAYGGLVKLHQDAIFGLVLRQVQDRLTAEELTQDVFVKAFRNLGSFRGDSKFSTWLYRIAVNVCYDYRGSSKARFKKEEVNIEPEPGVFLGRVDLGRRPDEEIATKEMAMAFQSCLDRLEPNYREAFLLRHQQGLSYDAIAEVLEISRSNAKVRVHRAREMILETMRKMGHDV